MKKEYDMTNAFVNRNEDKNSLDFYPTAPWVTRALFKFILTDHESLKSKTCLEPACGKGHISEVLKDYFGFVNSSDIKDYGYGKVNDFLDPFFGSNDKKYSWVITNPPFNEFTKFVLQAKRCATDGIAIFGRINYLESKERYEQLFEPFPPSIVAPFVERVPFWKNEVKQHYGSMVCYAWLVWFMDDYKNKETILRWIPPVKKQLEREEDYGV
jgi:hypothetical protein